MVISIPLRILTALRAQNVAIVQKKNKRKRKLLLLGTNEIMCNNCRYLSINESQQTNLRKLGYDVIHYCMKYNTRLYHGTNSRYHSNAIQPCRECEMEHKHEQGV